MDLVSSDYSPPALASDNSGAAVDWGDPESEDGFAAPFPHPPKKVQSYPVVQSTLTPRSIQTEALAKFMEAIQEGGKSKRVIVSLPTGGGKTVFGLMVAGQINGRVLWLAHRDELIDQPEAAVLATMPGLSCSVEKASRTSWDSRFVIASVQTLENPARVKNLLSNGPFDVVIYDECHHATAQASRTLLAQLGCMRRDGKGPHLLGLTATIERSDETSLLHVFDELIYNLSIQEAIDRGYLVPPVPIKVNLPINPRSLRVVNGEISSGDLDKELTRVNAAQATAATIMAHCEGRKTIVFCVSVDQAKRTSDACATLGLKAAWVSGTSYKRKVKKYRPDGSEETVNETRVGMSRAERKHVLKMFREGTINILTSADLLCLDEETQILTRNGWVGIESVSESDLIANWVPGGKIFFSKPKMILKRWRGEGEEMISVETTRRSIRVSDGHELVFKNSWTSKEWKKSAAHRLTNKKIVIPVSGNAYPETSLPEQPIAQTPAQFKRSVSAGAYNLRKREGFEWDASFQEAARRTARKYGLRYSNPTELTEDDCLFIGFWLADGSRVELVSGGIEYRLSQGRDWPIIVKWIDSLLKRLRFDYKRREVSNNAFLYSLPRGTGSGSQERRGVFRLEPYLKKEGPDLLWSLTEIQFDALLLGFWYGDGTHGQAERIPPKDGFRVSGSNHTLLHLLQRIAICRGYRATLKTRNQHKSKFTISIMCYTKISQTSIGGGNGKPLKKETNWKKERLWCVTSDSGFLITRRKGTVSVLGNCEGFDEPSVSAVVIAKPTLSKSRYIQMVGRGLRIFLGKKDCLVIDLVSASDFGLVTSGVLQDPVEKDKRLGGGGGGGSGENELCKVWKYIKSTTEGEYKDCGDVVFAKASDDIWITAAADGDLVVIRRVEGSEEWMVEHDSQAQSFPMSLQACMEHCRDVVMKQFGGGAAPGTKAWDKATDKPMPMPAFLPDAAPVQTVDPMPVTMTTGSNDLLQAAADELYARHVNALLDGVAAALKRGYCHFGQESYGSNLPPHGKETSLSLGWQVPGQFKPPTPRGRCAGYVKASNVYVNLSVGIEVATQAIQALVVNADHVKRKRTPLVEGGIEFVKFDCGDLLKRVES